MVSKLQLDGIGMTSQRTRNRMIEMLIAGSTEKNKERFPITNLQLLDAMLNTPRHIFIDDALASRAYELDVSLPIGHGQTISKPYTVARMTELLLEVSPKKVLEIGTGSGYQTAILSQFVDELYSVERIKQLLDKAKQRAKILKMDNVHFLHSDGGNGWSEHGPFDAILSAAAPRQIPNELKEQLCVGGRLVTPVGDTKRQNLYVVDRTEFGFSERVIEQIHFVPFVPGRLG